MSDTPETDALSSNPMMPPAARRMTVERLERERNELKALLEEAYVFFAMQHKACRPWSIAHNRWLDQVESITGWKPFDKIEDYRKKNK